jgi:Transglycosylase-like domain/LysM domain
LGAHSKPSRVRLPQAAAGAAVPTLGMAAAICLPAQAASAVTVPPPGTPATATATTGTAAAAAVKGQLPAAYQRPGRAALLAARGARHKPAAASYTVRPGDSLSAIAGRVYHDPAAWPVLYWGNRHTVRWANLISAGQVLTIPARPRSIPAPPARLGPAPAYTPRHATATPQAAPAAATATATAAPAATWSGAYPGGAFGACVVARESGGNPQVMNASGHYGLYQFAAATWAAYGGNPADFGHASVAEQNQVFATALARGGQNNWAPYDGC